MNFNQAWHKTSLVEGYSIFFTHSAVPLFKGESYRSRENKMRPFKSDRTNLNQTLHKTSLAEGTFYLIKAHSIFKGR